MIIYYSEIYLKIYKFTCLRVSCNLIEWTFMMAVSFLSFKINKMKLRMYANISNLYIMALLKFISARALSSQWLIQTWKSPYSMCKWMTFSMLILGTIFVIGLIKNFMIKQFFKEWDPFKDGEVFGEHL